MIPARKQSTHSPTDLSNKEWDILNYRLLLFPQMEQNWPGMASTATEVGTGPTNSLSLFVSAAPDGIVLLLRHGLC
jgi:hypothetical protein